MNKNLPVWLGLDAVRGRRGRATRLVDAAPDRRRRAGGLPTREHRRSGPPRSSAWRSLLGLRHVLPEPGAQPQPGGAPRIKGVPDRRAGRRWSCCVVLTFLLSRTPFGRHVYAVGGNAEAARRAGINVKRIKLLCFIICSTLAAVAGILLASRDNSVSPTDRRRARRCCTPSARPSSAAPACSAARAGSSTPSSVASSSRSSQRHGAAQPADAGGLHRHRPGPAASRPASTRSRDDGLPPPAASDVGPAARSSGWRLADGHDVWRARPRTRCAGTTWAPAAAAARPRGRRPGRT